MVYELLSKIYYKNPTEHEKIYQARYNAPTTKHFEVSIRQAMRQKMYPAFFCYTEEIVLLIEEIYKKQKNFLLLLPKVPLLVLNQFEYSCIVDEVKATSEIEGIHSTRRELKEIIEGKITTSQFSSIIKKYKLLTSSEILKFNTCEDIRNFYDDFAHKEFSKSEPNKKLDGKIFRKDSVDIASSTGKVLHRGLYPEEKIIETMTKALNILNDEKIPELIRIAIFHYFFEYIHPFYDGNGRTARFIASYFLRDSLNYLVALRLSVNIKIQRTKYYEMFKNTDSEINCGDLTPFVFGFLSIISETLSDLENIFIRKLNQLKTYRQKLFELLNDDELTLQIYELLLQSSMFFGGGISMAKLMELTRKSRNTIKSRIESSPYIVKSGNKKIFYKLDLKIFLS